MTHSQAPLTLVVWSDYVCPFCYLEVPELDALADRFGPQLSIKWRAFELRPAPVPTLDPDGDYLHDIWARAVYPMARERDMTLRLPRLQPRSRLAHEAAKWAMDHAAFSTLHHELFRGFFEDSLDLASPDALLDTARRLGLDEGSLSRHLAEGRYRDAVLKDQQDASYWGLNGVPAMLLLREGEALDSIQGAQSRDHLIQTVARFI
ncbi:DsbA family oxidoreductase [Modicisalibacter xianhensis]|uniref:Predicted dithiol-disulfide isomerase, DsbA family n=1 Tax=Modicisalibacter xianhensis TaxID=442341 RepID=A0A1I3CQR1_9GAMM|nr:DsbA family protein [Halomonas xianhensis]SFH76666.1 Predicted dithiol-disulfide isomerase, DsbA family [Halomonas xianhensis]